MSPDTPKSKFDKVLEAIESTSKVVSIAIPGVTLLTGAISIIKAVRTNEDGTTEYVIILTTGKGNLEVNDDNADYVIDLMNVELERKGKATIPK